MKNRIIFEMNIILTKLNKKIWKIKGFYQNLDSLILSGIIAIALKNEKNYRQEIISKCNKLENILYNQIKMENLMIDYKWNNPDLNKLDNNEFIFIIIQLKNLISSDEII